jgi:lysozyme family protein
MAQFEDCLEYVLSHEGGYVDHPKDPGGATNKGISIALVKGMDKKILDRLGIKGAITKETIKGLSDSQISGIYFSEFWNKAAYDKIMNGMIAKYIFDMSVHHGLVQSVKNTQRAACSAQKQKDYVKDDGIMGPKTIQAVNQASFSIIPALISERAGFMRRLVAVKPELSVFIDGWLSRAYDI